MTKKIIGAQGEVRVYAIDAIPECATTATEKNAVGDHIISHSERGHHHVLPGDATVMERTTGVPESMQVFYAFLNEPGSLRQDGPDPHGQINLDPGLYEFRVVREYNPFIEQARRVVD